MENRPSDSGSVYSGNQNPKDSPARPKRQRLNPVVVHLVKAGLRAEYEGYPDLAAMHFDFAEGLAEVFK